ncbi:MAG: peptidase [Burkholderiaceae bacterium]|jgi:putative proteasome-type protease
MTYCVATRIHAGIVFLSDSLTNAGVDQISAFRKMAVFEKPGERVVVLMSAGNLAITQAVKERLSRRQRIRPDKPVTTLWNAASMFDVAEVVGDALREVHARDAAALAEFGVEFNCNVIVGGQIKGEGCRVFHIYSAGNFIEATEENLYFQIGESKYGKPILDRVVKAGTSLEEAVKCLLISMDSTLRSNVSVGFPLDLLCYEADSLRMTRFAHINRENDYFQSIRGMWGERLKQVFAELPNPAWNSDAGRESNAKGLWVADPDSAPDESPPI